MTRKSLLVMGERGNRVKLFKDSDRDERPFIIQAGKRRKQFSFSTRTEAERFLTDRGWERSTLTYRAMWGRYKLEEERGLAPSTLISYEQAWERWEAYAGGSEGIVDETSAEQIYGFPRSLEQQLAAATVRTTLSAVRAVFGWAKRLELIKQNRWRDYRHKTSASRRTKQRAEYREGDFIAIWEALDPTDEAQWRAWVWVGLLGLYGARPSEILQLRWSWIDESSITLPAAIVKTREDRVLPLMPSSRAILELAAQWRSDSSPDAFVLPGRGGFYSLRAATHALRAAEDRAGVPHIQFRSGHAFRRGLVGDVSDSTGDVSLALLAVGDRNLSMAKHYRVRRKDTTSSPIALRAERLVSTQNVLDVLEKMRNEPATGPNPGPEPAPVTHTNEGT